jgi:glycyl-tRNA synthetase beta chain
LKQARQKNIAFPEEPAAPALREAAEKALFEKLQEISHAQGEAAGGRYVEALRSLVSLREPVDAFFNGVMVMDKDENVRANRLALLSTVVHRFKRVADLSLLQDVPASRSTPGTEGRDVPTLSAGR